MHLNKVSPNKNNHLIRHPGESWDPFPDNCGIGRADFYNRILRRSGKSQKAIVALARKLAVILWKLLLDNRRFMFDYSQPANFEA